jgi:hypothetical protein
VYDQISQLPKINSLGEVLIMASTGKSIFLDPSIFFVVLEIEKRQLKFAHLLKVDVVGATSFDIATFSIMTLQISRKGRTVYR